MIIYILNIKPSLKSVTETRLTCEGIWIEGFDPNDSAYEMCIDIYSQKDSSFPLITPERTIIVASEFYREMLEKYSCKELMEGVKIESIASIIDPMSLDKELLFEEEVRIIANNIIEAMDYADSDADFLATIYKQILGLKEKFKIYPK